MKDEVRALIAHRLQRISPQNCSKSPNTEISHVLRTAQAHPSPHIRRLRRSPEGLRVNATPVKSPIRVKMTLSAMRSRSQRTLEGESKLHGTSSGENVLNTPTFRQQTPATRSVERLLTLCDSFHDLPKANALQPPATLTSLASYVSLIRQTPGKRFFLHNFPKETMEMEQFRTGYDPATLQESIKAKNTESIQVYRQLGKRTLWRVDSRRLLRSTERLLVRTGR